MNLAVTHPIAQNTFGGRKLWQILQPIHQSVNVYPSYFAVQAINNLSTKMLIAWQQSAKFF